MPISLIKQYSVYLANQPGTLKAFADIFARENIDILAISQDTRYDSAVMRVAIEEDSDEISHSLSKAGFTSVKTDAICLELKNRVGAARDIGAILGNEGINITAIYGSASGAHSRLILIVNDIERAMDVLEKSKIAEI